MSSNFTIEQIKERFDSLPEDMKEVISAAETADRIEEIGRQHKLRIDKIDLLIEYSGLIMLGLIKSNQFVDELTKKLEISRELAETMAVEIDQNVFSRIRDSLHSMQYKSTAEKRFVEKEEIVKPISTDDSSKLPTENFIPSDASVPIEANLDLVDSKESIPKSLKDSMSTSDFTIKNNTTTTILEGENFIDNQVVETEKTDQIKTESTQATVPVPQTSTQQIKDFRERLEEKIAAADTTAQNNDPYKESI